MGKGSRKKQGLWPRDVSWHDVQGAASGLGAVMRFCLFLSRPTTSS